MKFPQFQSAKFRKFPKAFVAVSLSLALAVTPGTSALGLTRADLLSAAASTQTNEQLAETVSLAQAQGVAGTGVLQLYVSGQAITEDQLLSIDATALSYINLDLAQEIYDGQNAIKAARQQVAQQAAAQKAAEEQAAAEKAAAEAAAAQKAAEEAAAKKAAEEAAAAQQKEQQSEEQGSTDQDSQDQSGTSGDEGQDPAGSDESTDQGSSEDQGSETTDPSEGSGELTDDAANQEEQEKAQQNAVSAKDAVQAIANKNSAAPANNANVLLNHNNLVQRHISPSLTTQKFIAVIGEQAREVAAENNLYASVMIAQAILESASGNSTLASAPNNNLFGIKGNHNGNSVVMRTGEDDGSGNKYYISASFRKYDNMRQSLSDYAELLTDSMGSFYAGAWKSNAETYVNACDYLQGRYATDTSYSAKLQALIEAYDLTRYDQPLTYQTVETYSMQATDEDTGELLYDEQGNPVMEERTLADLTTELTSHLGENYVWGGTSCGSFDCSGLVQYCYQKALGIDLPRVAASQAQVGTEVSFITEDELFEKKGISTKDMGQEQAAEARKVALEEVSFDALHAGDLVFFAETGSVHHVGVYLGEGCFIHAPHTGDVVKITSLAEYAPSFAMRVVPVEAADTPEAPVEDTSAAEVEEAVQSAVDSVKIATLKVEESMVNRDYLKLVRMFDEVKSSLEETAALAAQQ